MLVKSILLYQAYFSFNNRLYVMYHVPVITNHYHECYLYIIITIITELVFPEHLFP